MSEITYKSGSGVIAAGRIVGKITQSGTYKPFDPPELTDEARMRILNIACWCAFVGRPELTDEYVASDMTVDEVRADLMAREKTAGIRYREVDTTASHQAGVLIIRQAEVVAARTASRKTPGHTEECECPRCMPGGPLV